MSELNPVDTIVEEYKYMLHPQFLGACIGPGWAPILKKMFAIIHLHIDRWHEAHRIKARFLECGKTPLPWIDKYFAAHPTNPFEDFKVVQIKSKFGTFRFYVDNGDEFIRGVIAMGESMANMTCERCGVFPRSEMHVC